MWVLFLAHRSFQKVAPAKAKYHYAAEAKIPGQKARFLLRICNYDKVGKAKVGCL